MTHDLTIISGTVLDENIRFTLIELCQLGKTSAEYIIEMVDEGVLEPVGPTPPDWQFDSTALKRLQCTIRLQRDLRINLPGVALVLDLLEELDKTKRNVNI